LIWGYAGSKRLRTPAIVYSLFLCDNNEEIEKEKYSKSFELFRIVIQSAFVNAQNIFKSFLLAIKYCVRRRSKKD
jgi:hypothetical protein